MVGITNGTTMTSAALSDLVEGPQLAVYTAKLWSAMGAAILAAPIVASFFTVCVRENWQWRRWRRER